MTAIDMRRAQQALYTAPSGAGQLVDVPPMRFLAIDGTGDPNTNPAYTDAVAALYAVSYTLKMLRKRAGSGDYTVMPLEGLWWMRDDVPYSPTARTGWAWTMLIRQPDDLTTEQFDAARAQVAQKKGLANLVEVRSEERHEGAAAQTLHLGPYADEAPTIALLHDFIAAQGRTPRGKHHEIYLSDPRRAAPERLRTILRQPIVATHSEDDEAGA